MTGLRDYQQQAIDNAHDHLYAKGFGGTIVHLATGLGKTRVASSFIHQHYNLHEQRVLFLVHTIDLIVQTYLEFQLHFPEWEATKYTRFSRPALGMVTGSHDTPHARIVIGTPQTLSGKNGTSARLDEVLQYGDFDLIIIDECHYAPSPSYLQLCKYLHRSKRLGLTATPMRTDGLALRQPLDKDDLKKGHLFDSICIRRNVRWGIDNHYLCPIRPPLLVETNIALPQGRGGVEERAKIIDVQNWAELVVDAYQEYGEDRIGAYFLPSVEHSRRVCEEFNERGIVAFHVEGEELLLPDGKMLTGKAARQQRRVAYDNLAKGIYRIGNNYDVLTTGWDCPPVALIGLARPTDSPVLVSQIIGRGTRNASGKNDLLILDYTLKDVPLILSGSLTGHVWDADRAEMIEDTEAEVEDLSDGVDLRDLKDPDQLVDGNGLLVRAGNLFRQRAEAWHIHDNLMTLPLSDTAMLSITLPNYTVANTIAEGLENGMQFLIENPNHEQAQQFYKDLSVAHALASHYTLWYNRKINDTWSAVKVNSADSPELIFDYAVPIIAELEDVALSRKRANWRRQPITDKQVITLRRLNVSSEGLNKGSASAMIAHCFAKTAVRQQYVSIMQKAGKYGGTGIHLY